MHTQHKMSALSHGPPLIHARAYRSVEFQSPVAADYVALSRDVDTPSVRTHLPITSVWAQPTFFTMYRSDGLLRVLEDRKLPSVPYAVHIAGQQKFCKLY